MSKYQKAIDKMSPMFSNARSYDNTTDDLQKQGLVDVQRHDLPIKPILLGYETYCVTWSLDEMADVIRSSNSDPAYMKELDTGSEEFSQGVANGQSWCYVVPVFVGRKPE